MIHLTTRTRAAVLAAAITAATAAAPFLAGGASAAATASTPTAGTIHLAESNNSLDGPNQVLITGAFSDHGTGAHGTWHLTHGTITSNKSPLNKIVDSPNFGTFYPSTCSFTGTAHVTVQFVSGTGAYAGIKGAIHATVTESIEYSRLANGKCNKSDSATPLAQQLIITGAGDVSF